MNRNNIIFLASQAEMPLRELDDTYCDAVGLPRGTVGGIDGVTIGDVQRFAELGIADFLRRTGQYLTNDAIREAVIADAVAEEREACAKICEETWVQPGDMQVESCHEAAALIRARGAA